MFRSLENEVSGYDISPDVDWADDHGVSITSLEALIHESDILTIHIPGNPDSIPILGKSELSFLKKGSFLINISRGNVVDESALHHLLVSKHIAGAAIDVFSQEPYVGPLCELGNVILTPHIGSYAAEGKLQMEIDAVSNLITALKE